MLSSADDLGAPGRDNQYGSGRINLARAVGGLGATGNPGGVTIPEPSTSTSTSPTPIDELPPDTTAPGGATPADTAPTTAPPVVEPGVTTPPVALDTAAPTVEIPGPVEESLPALPLTLAVLFVVSAAGGHAWRYLASTSWARRTPDRSPLDR